MRSLYVCYCKVYLANKPFNIKKKAKPAQMDKSWQIGGRRLNNEVD